MHHGAPIPTLRLPLVHLSQQVQEGLPGVRRVPISRPAKELEVPYQQVTLLQLGTQQPGRQRNMSTQAIGAPMTLRGSVKAALAAHPWPPQITHPRRVLHPEHSGHQIFICCARHKLHLHESVLLSAWLWPVLQAGLGHREEAE